MKQVFLAQFSISFVLCGFLVTQAVLAAPADDFVTTWKTDNPGPSNNTTIRVPMTGGPYDVDWENDGTFDEFGISGTAVHHYPVAGTYTIRVRGSYESIRFNNKGDLAKIISLDQWGTNSWTSMNAAFYGALNLQIPLTDPPDFSAVTDMSKMFMANWVHSASPVNPDTSNWNTSAVTDMSNMFAGATSANPNTSGWDTSAVTDMSSMFYGATSANPNTSGWDMSAVTDMSSMFYGADLANPDTSGWDTSAVTDMSSMFYGADLANPDTSGWDTSAVTDMAYMFMFASPANPDTSGWDTSVVTNFTRMFFYATSAKPDTSGWDTSSVTDMRQMFYHATSANPDTSGWDTSAVTDMHRMFSGATSANPDTSGWDTSAVADMSFMFAGATSANPDTSDWDTSAVVKMYATFADATSANPNTSGWDTSSVEVMSFMFSDAISANPDTSGWDTSAVTRMSSMFKGATSANPDTSGWNTSAVTGMERMFSGAVSANPDVTSWNTASVESMWEMFAGAISFARDISSWNVTSLWVGAGGMLDGVKLSNTNYENLLIGWSAQKLSTGVHFGGGKSTYCSAEAVAAKEKMITTFSWTIVDGGQACSPDPPTGTRATDGDYPNFVRITFSPVAGATVYRVYRCPDSGFTCGSPIGYPKTPAFDDSKGNSEQVYYYRVKACVANTCGEFSVADTGFTTPAPDQPTGIKATDGSFEDRVQITFNTVDRATVYRVFRCPDKGNTCGLPIGYPKIGSFDDKKGDPGTVYYYRVRACSVSTCGKFSAANGGHRGDVPSTEGGAVTAFMVPDQNVPIPALSLPGRWLLMLMTLAIGLVVVSRQYASDKFQFGR